MHQVPEFSQVIVNGRQLDQLAEKGDVARRSEVLVADDGFGYGFGLARFCCYWDWDRFIGMRLGCCGGVVKGGRGRRGLGLEEEEEMEGCKGAVEFKGEVGGSWRCGRGGGADVVEEGGERQGGRGEGRGLGGELLVQDGGCPVVDAHRVVVGLFGQVVFGVGLDAEDQGVRGGEGDGVDEERGGFVDVGLAVEDEGGVQGDGGPAVEGEVCWAHFCGL